MSKSIPPHDSGSAWVVMFCAIGIVYFAYFLMYLDLGCGFDFLAPISFCTPFQALLLICPVYAMLLWRWRHEIIPIDLNVIYAPFVASYLAFGALGKGKEMSNALLETTCVGLLMGLYLFKFPIARQLTGGKRKGLAVAFLLLECALAVLLVWLIPPIAD